jgi:hypothetical protein
MRKLLGLSLCNVLPRWRRFHYGTTAPTRSRTSTTYLVQVLFTQGPRPPTLFKYCLHNPVSTNTAQSPARDNLVSDSPSSSTMPPANTTSSGKEVPPPTDDLTKRLDRLEEMMCSLTGTVHDISQQQQGLGVAVIRLEQQVSGVAGSAPPPPAPQDATRRLSQQLLRCATTFGGPPPPV